MQLEAEAVAHHFDVATPPVAMWAHDDHIAMNTGLKLTEDVVELAERDDALGSRVDEDEDHVGLIDAIYLPVDLAVEHRLACRLHPGSIPSVASRVEDRDLKVGDSCAKGGLPVDGSA